MKLTKIASHLVLSGCLVLAVVPARATGIPTVDLLLNALSSIDLGLSFEEVANQIEQIMNQVRQIEQLEQQVGAMTGGRNLGDVLNNPALQSYVPADLSQTYGGIRNTGYAGLNGTARRLRDDGMVYNCLDMEGAARTACQAELAMPYQEKAVMQDALAVSQGRMGQIQSLMRRLGSTTDQAEKLEMVGRIEAEVAMVGHAQTQVDLARGAAEAERRIAESRSREAQLQQASRTGRLVDYLPH